jgi:alanine racemase
MRGGWIRGRQDSLRGLKTDVSAGDEVVLLGRQGADGVTAEDHAGWARTIPWEIFTSIAERVERRGI